MTTTDTQLPLLLIIALATILLLSVGIYRMGVKVVEATVTKLTKVRVSL
jgi:hypothetical protein